MSFQVLDGRVQGLTRWPRGVWGRWRIGGARDCFELNVVLRDGASRICTIVGFELPVRVGDEVTVIADATGRCVLAVVNHSAVDGENYLRDEHFLPVRVGELLALSFAFIASVAMWSSAGATWFALGAALYLVGAGALRGWLRRRRIDEVDCAINRAAGEFA